MHAGVPSSVVNYVLRKQESVTVSDPVRDLRFGQDAYIAGVAPQIVALRSRDQSRANDRHHLS